MSITVPQGGSIAGRSADVRIEQPDMGGFVAQVGSAVAQKMGQIKAQQRAVVVEKTKLDMTKEQGEAYQRVAQLTDPAEIETAWATEQAALRDKYVNGKDAAGNPLLTPEEADALTLTFDGLAVKHGFALGERTVKLTESQQAAAWDAARLDIVNTAATADPDTMAALVEMGEAAIDRLPGLMPEERQSQKAALRGEVANARATTALDQDPIAFIAAAEAGTYDELGPERLAQLKVTAQAEADRRAATAEKTAEAEAKTRSDAIEKRFKDIAGMEAKGLKATDRDYVVNAPPELQAMPGWAEARASIQLNDEMPKLDVMSVAELDAAIAAEQGRTYDHEWQAQRLTVLRAKRDKLATEVATDPKSAAIARGVIAPKGDLAFDPADPDAFAASLAEAVSQDQHLREKGYTSQSAVFSKTEKAELQAILAPEAEAGPKVALMTAILQGSEGRARSVMAALEADPLNRRALTVLGLTGDTALTEGILRGGQKIAADTTLKLPRGEQIAIFDSVTGGSFSDAPVAMREELMAAAAALYADGAQGLDPADDPEAATALYTGSLQRLLGAQTDRNGAYTVGGLQEVNGGLTVLPVGVSVAQVESAWDAIADGFTQADPAWYQKRIQLGPVATPEQGDPMAGFQAASVYGGIPDLGSDPAGRMGSLTLRRVGETDVYELVRDQGGRLTPVPEVGKGHAYRFRLKDLMRGGRP